MSSALLSAFQDKAPSQGKFTIGRPCQPSYPEKMPELRNKKLEEWNLPLQQNVPTLGMGERGIFFSWWLSQEWALPGVLCGPGILARVHGEHPADLCSMGSSRSSFFPTFSSLKRTTPFEVLQGLKGSSWGETSC